MLASRRCQWARTDERPVCQGIFKNQLLFTFLNLFFNNPISRWKFCVHADKRQMLLDLTHSLQLRPTRVHVLWELANCISSAVGADDFRLYLADASDMESTTLYIGQDCYENGEPKMQKSSCSGDALTVHTYVARTRETIRLSRGDIDSRFPEGISNKVSRSVLCM